MVDTAGGHGGCDDKNYVRYNSQAMKRTPIRRVSKKQAILLEKYRAIKTAFLKRLPFCAICERNSDEVHHMKGRGKYLLDEDTWLAVCRKCHTRAHRNVTWALEKGWTLKRGNA